MTSDSIFRLSLIVGDGQAVTFKTNLRKMSSVILFDNCNQPLTADEIVTKISSQYELEFTTEEVSEALSTNEFVIGSRVEKSETRTTSKTLFSLSKELFLKISKRDIELRPEEIFTQFLNTHPSIELNIDEFSKLIANFLYYSFNSSKNTILALINRKYTDALKKYEADNSQITIINEFLNWDCEQKDIFVYSTISYCIDYCMLSAKKDNTYLSSVFQGKQFFLDANVIFRLAGFNNEERKMVIDAFVKKCKECKITLLYTNFTYQELINTVDRSVASIELQCKEKYPLSHQNYSRYTPTFRNSDFYYLYYQWCQQGNKYNKYDSFKSYLTHKIYDVLKDLKKVTVKSFKTTERAEFEKLSQSLKDHKNEKHAQFTDESIDVDINNFMNLFYLRTTERGSSMFNIKNYFISTDSNLCTWSKETVPGDVPICILPSVGYSIILKLNGRAKNDYKAFNLFLNLRFRTVDDDETIVKRDILSLVESLDEPTFIKDRLLDNIYSSLSGKFESITQPREIVEKEFKSLILTEAETISKGKENGLVEQGKQRAYHEIAEKRALKKQQWYSRISKVAAKYKKVSFLIEVFLGLVFIGAVLYLLINGKILEFFQAFNNDELDFDITHYITIISLAIGIINALIIKPVKKLIKPFGLQAQIDKELKKLTNE